MINERESTPLLSSAKGGGHLSPMMSVEVEDDDANLMRRRNAGSSAEPMRHQTKPQTQHYFGGKFDLPPHGRASNHFESSRQSKKSLFRPSWTKNLINFIRNIFHAKPNIQSKEDESQYYQDTHNDLPWACTFGTSPHDGIWLNYNDAPGLIMSSIVWLLIIYSGFTVTLLVKTTKSMNPMISIFYTTFCALALASHAKTTLTDPGSIPLTAVPTEEDGKLKSDFPICTVCQTYKPAKTHHCRICNRCISGMDHHCPWMNNCIGQGNLKHFLLFLLYVWTSSAYALLLFGINYFFCGSDACAFDGIVVQLVRVMTLLCIFALIFTSNMLVNVVWTIMTGLGTIDRLKMENDARKKGNFPMFEEDFMGEPMSLTDIFGIGPYWTWILPIDPMFHDYDKAFRYSTTQRLLREKNEREELNLI